MLTWVLSFCSQSHKKDTFAHTILAIVNTASFVPRPVGAIRVTRGGLERSTIANFSDKLDRWRLIRNRRGRLGTRLEYSSFKTRSISTCKWVDMKSKLFAYCCAYSMLNYIDWLVVCLCDFAKRCSLSFRLNTGITRVQASVAEKKKKSRGLAVLLGLSREPRPRPIPGWVADLFCVKTLSLWLSFVSEGLRIFPEC